MKSAEKVLALLTHRMNRVVGLIVAALEPPLNLHSELFLVAHIRHRLLGKISSPPSPRFARHSQMVGAAPCVIPPDADRLRAPNAPSSAGQMSVPDADIYGCPHRVEGGSTADFPGDGLQAAQTRQRLPRIARPEAAARVFQ
jgi:hypothetical protein